MKYWESSHKKAWEIEYSAGKALKALLTCQKGIRNLWQNIQSYNVCIDYIMGITKSHT